MNNSTKIDILHFFLFLSIIFSYIIYEDTLGGAKLTSFFMKNNLFIFKRFIRTLKNYASLSLPGILRFFHLTVISSRWD